jgi:hypothetical protein
MSGCGHNKIRRLPRLSGFFSIFPSAGMQTFKGRRSVPSKHRKPDGSAQAGGGRPEL